MARPTHAKPAPNRSTGAGLYGVLVPAGQTLDDVTEDHEGARYVETKAGGAWPSRGVLYGGPGTQLVLFTPGRRIAGLEMETYTEVRHVAHTLSWDDVWHAARLTLLLDDTDARSGDSPTRDELHRLAHLPLDLVLFLIATEDTGRLERLFALSGWSGADLAPWLDDDEEDYLAHVMATLRADGERRRTVAALDGDALRTAAEAGDKRAAADLGEWAELVGDKTLAMYALCLERGADTMASYYRAELARGPAHTKENARR